MIQMITFKPVNIMIICERQSMLKYKIFFFFCTGTWMIFLNILSKIWDEKIYSCFILDNFIIKTNKKIKIEICFLGNSYTVSKVESWATAKVFILVSLNVHIKNMQWFFQSKIIVPLESAPSVYLWIHSRLGRWKTTKISQILKLLNSLQFIDFSWAIT